MLYLRDSNAITDDSEERTRTAEHEYREALNAHSMELSLRKRVEEMHSGEKATKYYCNLMKNQAAQKYIPKLINDDGSETQRVFY